MSNAENFNDLAKRAALFVVIMAIVGAALGILLASALLGFLGGLVAATFAVGSAVLKQRSDGSWTLIKRS